MLVSTPAVLTAEAFQMPEGFTIDNDAMKTFLDVFNNSELTPTQRGQALIELQAGLSTKSEEARSQAWQEQRQAWVKSVSDDPELGGANLTNTLSSIGALMDRHGNDEIRAAFDQTGAGDHPAIVKFLHSLSKLLVEAKPTALGNPAPTTQLSLADRIYGKKPNS